MATLRTTAVVAVIRRRIPLSAGRGCAVSPVAPIDDAPPIVPLFAPLPDAPGDPRAARQREQSALPKLPAAMIVLLGGH